MILGLHGGGRLDGNSATVLADLLEGAHGAGASTATEQLTPSRVHPIGDCGVCARHGQCLIVLVRIHEANPRS